MSSRVLQPELMDDPHLSAAEHVRALRGLARLNRLSRAADPFIHEARRLSRTMTESEAGTMTGTQPRPVQLVDVAAARRAGVPIDLTLMDISRLAMDVASSNAARAKVPANVVIGDARTSELPRGDIVMCSLFLHHLNEDDCTTVLARMRDAARAVVIVSDLRRSAYGRLLSTVVPRLLCRSHVVHVDAARSAHAAWTIDELRAIAARAQMPDADVRSCFPARLLMRWRRKAP